MDQTQKFVKQSSFDLCPSSWFPTECDFLWLVLLIFMSLLVIFWAFNSCSLVPAYGQDLVVGAYLNIILGYGARWVRVAISKGSTRWGASFNFTGRREPRRLPKRRISLKIKTMDKVRRQNIVSISRVPTSEHFKISCTNSLQDNTFIPQICYLNNY